MNVDSELLASDPTLSTIVARLVAALAPVRIYLFGSRARGEAGPESDYDLMVVVSASEEPAYRRARAAYRALDGLATAVDVLVWTRKAFDERLHLRASFPSTIVREGRLLYAA